MFRFILKLLGISQHRTGRRPRRATPARQQQARYQNTRTSPIDRPVTAKTPAASGTVIRERISTLPKFRTAYVIDGDTVIVSDGWTKIRVRLDSIDCPEDGQHWGDTAKYGLMKLIARQHVHLEVHGQDVHGRMLATIYVWHSEKGQWLNVNERMVMLGHAWVMRRYYDHLPNDRQDQLNRLERWAQSKKVGLWGTPSPIPPWQWRNGP